MAEGVANWRRDKLLQRVVRGKLESQPQTFTDVQPQPEPAAGSQPYADAETKVEAKPQPEPHAEAQVVSQPQTNTQADTFADTQANTQTHPSSDTVTTAETLRARKGTRRPRLEDERRRQTYWLHEVEIQMVERLAEATGLTKYEVVATAIRELHRAVMEE